MHAEVNFNIVKGTSRVQWLRKIDFKKMSIIVFDAFF